MGGRAPFLRAAAGVSLLMTAFVFGMEVHSAISSPDPVNYSTLIAMVAISTVALSSYVNRRNDGE